MHGPTPTMVPSILTGPSADNVRQVGRLVCQGWISKTSPFQCWGWISIISVFQCRGWISITSPFQCWGWISTRRSENDNTPQPLDQWTNSSFIGQQVGNCKSFTLTHYFADLSAMHRGRRSIPLCIQHHIQLTSLSFQVSQTSHCWVTAISIFYLENPRSRSWVRSKFEVTMWV